MLIFSPHASPCILMKLSFLFLHLKPDPQPSSHFQSFTKKLSPVYNSNPLPAHPTFACCSSGNCKGERGEVCRLAFLPGLQLFSVPWTTPGKNTGACCHFLHQGDLPSPGIEPSSLVSPASAGRFFTTHAAWGAPEEDNGHCLKAERSQSGARHQCFPNEPVWSNVPSVWQAPEDWICL